MTPNNVLSRLAIYAKVNPLNTILALTLLAEFFIAIMSGPMQWPDSLGYYKAADKLSNGEIDITRTPVCPLLYLLAGIISESAKLWIVGVIQIILFLFSVKCFFRVAKEMKLSNTIVIVSTCIYVISTQFISHNMTMTSEPVSVSLCVFLIYYFFKWYRNSSLKSWSMILLLSILLIFTRPSFLYLPVAIAIMALIYLCIRQYKRALQMITCTAVCGGLMFGYCKMMERKIGVFTPTVVSLINDSCIATRAGLFTSNNVVNPDIKERLITFEHRTVRNPVWDYPNLDGISYKALHDELVLIKGNTLSWYIKVLKSNYRDFLKAPVVSIIPSRHLYGINIFITFSQLCVIMLISAICLIAYRKRSGIFPLFSIFLWLMCAGNLAVNLLGSFAEWSRLFMPSISLFLLLCGELCNRLRLTYIKGKPFA